MVVVDRRLPSLQAVTSCTADRRPHVDESAGKLVIDAALAADELMITQRKEVTDDMGPLVFGLTVDQPLETEYG